MQRDGLLSRCTPSANKTNPRSHCTRKVRCLEHLVCTSLFDARISPRFRFRDVKVLCKAFSFLAYFSPNTKDARVLSAIRAGHLRGVLCLQEVGRLTDEHVTRREVLLNTESRSRPSNRKLSAINKR